MRNIQELLRNANIEESIAISDYAVIKDEYLFVPLKHNTGKPSTNTLIRFRERNIKYPTLQLCEFFYITNSGNILHTLESKDKDLLCVDNTVDYNLEFESYEDAYNYLTRCFRAA